MPKFRTRLGAHALMVAVALSVAGGAVADPIIPELVSPAGVPLSLVESVNALVSAGKFDEALRQINEAQKNGPPNADLISLQGAVYLERKDLDNARKSFRRALSLSKPPNSARAMVGMGAVALAAGNTPEYIDWLEKAGKADPSLLRPRVDLVKLYLGLNQPQKALTVAQDLYARHPDSLVAIDMLGAAQLATGQNEGALRSYSQIATLQPNDATAHYRRALALEAMRDHDRAADALRRALSLKADFVEAKVLLSTVELRRGHADEALRLAREVKTERPGSASGWQAEGDVLMVRKDYSGAKQAYDKAFQLAPTGALVVKRSAALAGGGKPQDAEALLLAWLKDHPDDRAVRLRLGSTYAEQGRQKDAIAQYESIVKADPSNAAMLNDLAWLYQQAKDPRALATAEQAYKLMPDAPQTADTLGWILISRGDTNRGLTLLRRAAELAPADPAIRYHLADAYAKSGQPKLARAELEKALQKDEKFVGRAEAEALLAQLSK